jgi:hypothetical protein
VYVHADGHLYDGDGQTDVPHGSGTFAHEAVIVTQACG